MESHGLDALHLEGLAEVSNHQVYDLKEVLVGAGLLSNHLATTTPQRSQEGKRRRLTIGSEPSETPCSSCRDTTEDECDAVAAGLQAVLRGKMRTWSRNLVRLQPKVHVSEYLLECGLWLFRNLRNLQVAAAAAGVLPAAYLTEEQYLLHDLIACWWLAMKHCSVRTAVPNRTLMCRATGACPALLSDRELATLISLNWRVSGVLSRGDLLS
ncbi:hypothetical protein ACKKBG_A15420 [Auxenochlorella protothecoides x Auxenochlorella symbiontica]